MRIEVRGRNTEVTEELRDAIEKRFARVGHQVSDLATLEVELTEERNPSISDSQIAEATLYLKRATLRAPPGQALPGEAPRAGQVAPLGRSPAPPRGLIRRPGAARLSPGKPPVP